MCTDERTTRRSRRAHVQRSFLFLLLRVLSSRGVSSLPLFSCGRPHATPQRVAATTRQAEGGRGRVGFVMPDPGSCSAKSSAAPVRLSCGFVVFWFCSVTRTCPLPHSSVVFHRPGTQGWVASPAVRPRWLGGRTPPALGFYTYFLSRRSGGSDRIKSPASIYRVENAVAFGGCNFGKTPPVARTWLGLVDLSRIPSGIFFSSGGPSWLGNGQPKAKTTKTTLKNVQNKAK